MADISLPRLRSPLLICRKMVEARSSDVLLPWRSPTCSLTINWGPGQARLQAKNGSLWQGVLNDRHEDLWHRLSAGSSLKAQGLPAPGYDRLRRAKKRQSYRQRFGDSPIVCVGLEPVLTAGRTDLDSDLGLERPGGLDISVHSLVPGGYVLMEASIGLAAFEERDSGKRVGMFRLDVGMGLGGEGGSSVGGVTTGPSLLILDFGGDGRNTFGLGWFLRPSIDFSVWGRWGLRFFGDLHGWIGVDSRRDNFVGRASLGAGIAVGF